MDGWILLILVTFILRDPPYFGVRPLLENGQSVALEKCRANLKIEFWSWPDFSEPKYPLLVSLSHFTLEWMDVYNLILQLCNLRYVLCTCRVCIVSSLSSLCLVAILLYHCCEVYFSKLQLADMLCRFLQRTTTGFLLMFVNFTCLKNVKAICCCWMLQAKQEETYYATTTQN